MPTTPVPGDRSPRRVLQVGPLKPSLSETLRITYDAGAGTVDTWDTATEPGWAAYVPSTIDGSLRSACATTAASADPASPGNTADTRNPARGSAGGAGVATGAGGAGAWVGADSLFYS